MLNYVTINFMFEIIMHPQIQYLLILQDFREFSNGVFDNLFLFVTMLGENFILLSFATAIYWVVNKKAGIFLFFNLAISVILNLFVKLTACINRPWILDSRVCPIEQALPQADGYSFPSGHTARAMGVWGSICYWWWNNKFIRYASLFIVLLVGFSRNYIGVHTPQDVIVSIILGILIILGLSKILTWIDYKPNRDLIIFTLLLFLGVLIYLFLYIKCANQMLTYDTTIHSINPLAMKHSEYGKLGFFYGVLCGWIIEKRFVNFNTEKLFVTKKIIITVVGLLLLNVLPSTMCFLFGNVLPSQILSALIKFSSAIFILALYPIFIKFVVNR